MNSFQRLCLVLSLSAAVGQLHAKEEIVSSSDDRKISINIPDGFTFSSNTANGVVAVEIADAKGSLSLHLDLVPDPNARLGLEDSQKSMLAELSQTEAEQSVEKSYDFQSLEPRVGHGVYLVFTDATLVGKTPPPGEFNKLTRGVKSWSGFAVIFTLVSQDSTSDGYRAAMKILKQSVEEKKPTANSQTL